jgi:hypothetical protein
MENAIMGFIRAYQRESEPKLPPGMDQRALLKAQFARLSSTAANRSVSRYVLPPLFAWAAALCGLLVLG